MATSRQVQIEPNAYVSLSLWLGCINILLVGVGVLLIGIAADGKQHNYIGLDQYSYTFPKSFNYELIKKGQHFTHIKGTHKSDILDYIRNNGNRKNSSIYPKTIRVKENDIGKKPRYELEQKSYSIHYKTIFNDCHEEKVIEMDTMYMTVYTKMIKVISRVHKVTFLKNVKQNV